MNKSMLMFVLVAAAVLAGCAGSSSGDVAAGAYVLARAAARFPAGTVHRPRCKAMALALVTETKGLQTKDR